MATLGREAAVGDAVPGGPLWGPDSAHSGVARTLIKAAVPFGT